MPDKPAAASGNEEVNLTDISTELENKAAEDGTPVLPDKYQNKSLEDIVAMHVEAEKALGRQGSELGNLRKLTDQLVESEAERRATKDQASDKPIEFNDDNPLESIREVVQRELAKGLSPVHDRVNKLDSESVTARLDRAHKGWNQTVTTDEFKTFANSSATRRRLWEEGNGGNFDSADELLTVYKQLNPAKEEETPEAKAQKLKNATLESGTSPKPARGRKPVWRKADIRELRMKDPDKYYSMLSEISAAYQDGRVK